MGLIWAPQPGPQKALIDCPAPDILFGGARGGGKSDGVLGKYALKQDLYGRGFNAVVFRPQIPQADDLIERSEEVFRPLGAEFNRTKNQWQFAKGGRLRFRPLETIRDAAKYQGQNLSDAAVEEAGNYADPAPIDRLWGALRSRHGIPAQLILTANPGGPGQLWIRRRYMDPAPGGMRIIRCRLPNGEAHRRVFIPSKVQDNRILLRNDPEYVNRLHLVGSAELVKAWLDGNWDVVEGAYFDCWDPARHVVRPFAVPAEWTRFRSGDWGSARPFSFGWWAVVGEDFRSPDGAMLPRGMLLRISEWYGCQAERPNVGLKLDNQQIGAGLWRREQTLGRCAYGVLDGACFAEDGGPSIHEQMARGAREAGGAVWFRPADKRRLPGWTEMRGRMIGDADGRPMIGCFSTCRDSIRTIPILQHDPAAPEDLDTRAEDHAADDWRYACMSRPLVNAPNEPGRRRGRDYDHETEEAGYVV